ncbi:MAG: LamG domain-containing protein [Opitutaceae bacterium]|jgi:hypothetical protein
MSLVLNGSSQYLYAADAAVLTLTPRWSLGGWLKIASNAGNYFQYFLSWGTLNAANSLNWYFGEAGDATIPNKCRFAIRDATHDAVVVDTTGTPGTSTLWQHVLLVCAGETLTQYINGSADGTANQSGFGAVNDGNALYLGSRSYTPTDRMFKGSLAEWAKWDRALSAAEIAALVAGAKPGDVGTPVWWLPMRDDKESDLGSLTTTLVGSPTWDSADHPVSYVARFPWQQRRHRRMAGAY